MNTHAFASPFRPFNPFIASAEEVVEIEEVAEAREFSYALVQSGPAVSADEVESNLDAVEVKVSWGTQVMSLTHLDAKSGFAIGEGGDFVVPNAARTDVVARRLGASYVIVPPGGTATVSAKGEHPRTANAGEEILLTDGIGVRIELEPVTIEIASVRAGKKIPVGFLTALAGGAAAAIGLSFLGHAAIVASMALFMPKMADDDAEGITREQLLSMQAMLDSAADRELEKQKEEPTASADQPTGGGSKGGEPHKGDTGAAGTTKPVTTSGHMSFKGADDHARLSKREEMDLAANGGLIGFLRSGAPEAGHTSPWATETQLGQDAENKLGAMFGADANDAMGYGLGLWGTGEGAGGKGEGIGIDGVGSTVGGGGGGTGKWGYGKGDKDGLGNGHGPGSGAHVTRTPTMRTPDFNSNGRLPAEVIQRIVRQNFGRFRLCYEAGARTNPSLTGRVSTKFVIGRDGLVAQAADAGSDMPNHEVVSCVVRSFNNLTFPQPEGGIATVTYPIVFSPGE